MESDGFGQDRGFERKAEEIFREILAGDGLRPLAEAREAAENELAALRRTQTALAERARRLVDIRAAAEAEAAAAVVAAARNSRSGAGWEAAAERLRRIDEEQQAVARGNRKLVEELIPAAEVHLFEQSAAECEAQGQAVQDAARERMEKTARLLAGAAAHEGGIVFDPWTTVSGVLEARAQGLFALAEQHRRRGWERRERHAGILRRAAMS